MHFSNCWTLHKFWITSPTLISSSIKFLLSLIFQLVNPMPYWSKRRWWLIRPLMPKGLKNYAKIPLLEFESICVGLSRHGLMGRFWRKWCVNFEGTDSKDVVRPDSAQSPYSETTTYHSLSANFQGLDDSVLKRQSLRSPLQIPNGIDNTRATGTGYQSCKVINQIA